MKHLTTLILLLMTSVCSYAQLFDVGNQIPEKKDFLLGFSGGFDGFNYHGKNAYRNIINPYGKLSFARYYTDQRGFHASVSFHNQDILKSDENSIVHDKYNIIIFADDMYSLSKKFFNTDTDGVWGWDFYYGIGVNLINVQEITADKDVVYSNRRTLAYPIIHVGTIGRYQIFPFLEGFADISYNFTGTNMYHLQHGTHHYMELGLGLIYRFSIR